MNSLNEDKVLIPLDIEKMLYLQMRIPQRRIDKSIASALRAEFIKQGIEIWNEADDSEYLSITIPAEQESLFWQIMRLFIDRNNITSFPRTPKCITEKTLKLAVYGPKRNNDNTRNPAFDIIWEHILYENCTFCQHIIVNTQIEKSHIQNAEMCIIGRKLSDQIDPTYLEHLTNVTGQCACYERLMLHWKVCSFCS